MIYIDTNVFIYAIEDNQKYGKACAKIIVDIESEKIKTATSVQTLVEIINVLTYMNWELKKRKMNQLDIQRNIELVLSLPITWFDLDFFTIKKASSYKFEITGADFVHVATMEVNSIKEIITADKDFDKVDIVKRIDPLAY